MTDLFYELPEVNPASQHGEIDDFERKLIVYELRGHPSPSSNVQN